MSDPPPFYRKFVSGALAAMAGSAASHPLDVIKVNLQVQGEKAALQGNSKKLGPFSMGVKIFKTDGINKGLFKGLSASLFRQAIYSGVRFGVYDLLVTNFKAPDEEVLPLFKKILCGLAAGGIGAFAGTPSDVVLVRMQADSTKPVELRRNYGNILNGFRKVVSEEGFLTLYSGVTPTVVRAMLVTVAQFATYDQIKEKLVRHVNLDETAVTTHLLSGTLAGFVASIVSNPVDVIKTRMMNMKVGQYKHIGDCIYTTLKTEGFSAFYKGFIPTLGRTAPYVMVMFVTMEQLNNIFRFIDNRQNKT